MLSNAHEHHLSRHQKRLAVVGRPLVELEVAVSPFPKTDTKLDAEIEATLEVRLRTDAEGVLLYMEGLGDVKLMTGEAWCFCEGVATDVSDMTRAPGWVDGTTLRFPLILGFPITLMEVEADNECGKALEEPAWSGRWHACREMTGTLQGSGCHIGGACIRSRIRIRDGFGGIGLDSRAPAGIACNGQCTRVTNGRSGSIVLATCTYHLY
jgi:hypothetical protein